MVDLPKQSPNWTQVITFGGIFSLSSVSLLLLISYLSLNVLYGEIITITLGVVTFIGMILGGYGLINTIYQHPILILTTEHIYLGLKGIFRSPLITNHGIIPKEDLKLIIVKDSRTTRFRLFLEGRQLLQLGVYKTIKETELQRISIKNLLTDHYPLIYISSPKYHEI